MLGCWIVMSMGLAPATSWGCSVPAILSGGELVRSADVIIRGKAVEYARPPSDPMRWTTGVPDSRVRFEKLEIVRGTHSSDLILPGYLVARDDFNDQQPPYTFVRPGGRGGSCFANSYRKGEQYLLFLKKTKDGVFTVNWAPLAPVNEQLRSPEDAWLRWVREQSKKMERDPAK